VASFSLRNIKNLRGLNKKSLKIFILPKKWWILKGDEIGTKTPSWQTTLMEIIAQTHSGWGPIFSPRRFSGQQKIPSLW